MRITHIPIAKPHVPLVAGGYYEQHGSPMILADFDDNIGSSRTYMFINAVNGKPITSFLSREDVDRVINDGSFIYYDKAEIHVPGNAK